MMCDAGNQSAPSSAVSSTPKQQYNWYNYEQESNASVLKPLKWNGARWKSRSGVFLCSFGFLRDADLHLSTVPGDPEKPSSVDGLWKRVKGNRINPRCLLLIELAPRRCCVHYRMSSISLMHWQPLFNIRSIMPAGRMTKVGRKKVPQSVSDCPREGIAGVPDQPFVIVCGQASEETAESSLAQWHSVLVKLVRYFISLR